MVFLPLLVTIVLFHGCLATGTISIVDGNINGLSGDDQVTYPDRNITLLERFQFHIPGSERVLRMQEEQLKREEQIRNGVRTRARTGSCPKPTIRCFRSKYRTIDGTCNNPLNPRLGMAGECGGRMLSAEYADRISAPRISVVPGRVLPNPRVLSLSLHSDPSPPAEFTQLLMIYGQFLDHDISFTPLAESSDGNEIECCPRGSSSRWCMAISLPADDPFFSRFNQRCLEFIRSAACLTCTWGPRSQINELTSYIDASSVYGSSLNETRSLRAFDGSGSLKVNLDRMGHQLLPRSVNVNEDGCSQPARRSFCFNTGDVRVNQQAPLASLHTIFHRQHNRITKLLKRINRHWDDETVFQETRRIIGAQLQVVAYKEWLPLIMGPTMMEHYRLTLLPSGFTEYDATLDPSILSEFSTAAFRFGHSLIRSAFARVSSSGRASPYLLKDNFFKPTILREGTIDSVIRGLLSTPASVFSQGVDEDVRNHLYRKSEDRFGSDLVAINIQRGRDHAIPSYVTMIKHCYGKDITEWAQLEAYMSPGQILKYQQLYAHIRDIDLFSGGLSEFSLPGAIVGPTFACIIGNQFRNLRFGDRFWFEHANQDGSFTEAQIQNLRETTLAKVLCENGDDFLIIHPRVFLPVSAGNPLTQCSQLPDIDVTLWADSSSFRGFG